MRQKKNVDNTLILHLLPNKKQQQQKKIHHGSYSPLFSHYSYSANSIKKPISDNTQLIAATLLSSPTTLDRESSQQSY